MKRNSKFINIEEESKKLEDLINEINLSNLLSKLNNALNQYENSTLNPLQEKNITIYGRLKKFSSAINKISHKNISVDEIYDLIAFMIVVDLPEDYINIQQTLLNTLPGLTYEHLFIGSNPECNGYSSLHLGIDINTFLSSHDIKYTNLKNLQAELQLKTYGMYMAQEATHDSIYKNDSLSSKEKLEMQTFMFPLIEHLTDIEMYERKLNATVDEEKKKDIEEKILSLKQTIQKHKECNTAYISENISLIDSVFKEYVARKSIEKLKKSVDLKLTSEQAEDLIYIYRNAINYLSTSQKDETLTDTGITGFKNIDSLLAQIDGKTFNEVFDLTR